MLLSPALRAAYTAKCVATRETRKEASVRATFHVTRLARTDMRTRCSRLAVSQCACPPLETAAPSSFRPQRQINV